ncbi:MAG TPA: phosphoribosylglycinamide formyltransferase [Gemmata sp.]|jgi:phosphoribosylglycinamide formyltransferase-1|nr:phosphoribosylglycinamide formyltransferase [Gemmata sp.]
MTTPIRLVTLISGGGTTLQNLIDRIAMGTLDAKIVGVVSSRADVLGVERAKRAGLSVSVVASGGHELASGGRADRVWTAIRSFNPDLVCFTGWLHLLPIPEEFRQKVLNIHPSLLPAFGGKGMYGHHVHEAVLAYGAKVSGCTVHFADDTYDTGPILVQKCVPVKEGDNADTLAARVFQAECEAYPEAINLIAAGRVTVQDRRVIISG